jgi:hypothetical protein
MMTFSQQDVHVYDYVYDEFFYRLFNFENFNAFCHTNARES